MPVISDISDETSILPALNTRKPSYNHPPHQKQTLTDVGLPPLASTTITDHNPQVQNKYVRIATQALMKAYHARRKIKHNSTMLGEEKLRVFAHKWKSKVEQKSIKKKKSSSCDSLSPFGKFVRAAKTVKNLIHVCKVCQALMEAAVSAEDWYRLMDTYLDTSSSLAQHAPKTRPFITFVPDEQKKGLTQLTFDKSEFARDCRADYLLNDDIRDLLKMKPHLRSAEQENELLRFLKKLSPDFSAYSLDTQRRLLACMFYDKYERNRVITRAGLQADGVYFVISGALVEKTGGKKELRELKAGQRFGEKDIECGCARRTTVVTRTEVELVTVHRLDYRSICNMADDSNNPKYLEVCKRDVVFQHFPLKKLVDNPGVWTVLSYKFGRLMVKDSNDLEWIYIIKSGEARVIKQLQAQKVNVSERHKQIQAKIDEQDPFHSAQKMIHFVSADTASSNYKLGQYHPRVIHSAPATLSSKLATCGSMSKAHILPPARLQSRSSSRLTELLGSENGSRPNTSHSVIRSKSANADPMVERIRVERNRIREEQEKSGGKDQTSPAMWSENRLGLLAHTDIDAMGDRGYSHRKSITLEKIKLRQEKRLSLQLEDEENSKKEEEEDNKRRQRLMREVEGDIVNDEDNVAGDDLKSHQPFGEDELQEETNGQLLGRREKSKQKVRIIDVNEHPERRSSDQSGQYLSTGQFKMVHRTQGSRGRKVSSAVSSRELQKETYIDVPPFVQLESLHTGMVFGMRSCLEEEERGPSASLVSGGCEVLQINKKFFLKNADEALLGLIKVKHKPYPSEEDLLDRLDVNFQWDSFKHTTVNGFVNNIKRRRGRVV